VGSTALQPLVTNAAKAYQQQHPQVHIQVDGGGSVTGLVSVTSQKSDIGDSDIYADPAIYPDPNVTDHIVCVIPFAMITGPDVNVHSLTRQQIIDIFSTNTIRNWQAVGGPDLPIVPVVRPNTSGTRATFRKYILQGRDENGKLLQTDSSKTVLSTVAHTPGAIGYIALSVVDHSVKQVAIDGKLATPENIANGSYNYWGYEHMYTMGDNNTLIKDFLNYMLAPTTQQLAAHMGYIPIAKMNITRMSNANNRLAVAPLAPLAPLARRESEDMQHES
jgi:phosphate transport system substrate-binding protein